MYILIAACFHAYKDGKTEQNAHVLKNVMYFHLTSNTTKAVFLSFSWLTSKKIRSLGKMSHNFCLPLLTLIIIGFGWDKYFIKLL